MKEYFEIPGIGRYLISRCGSILNSETGKERKHVLSIYGYPTVVLRLDGKYKGFFVHRLLALTFIPNPECKPHVNHINGIRHDFRIKNLEWCTAKENMRHAYDVLGRKGPKSFLGKFGYDHNKSHEVLQISLDGFLIGVYGSVREASRETGVPKSTILLGRKNKPRKFKPRNFKRFIWI